MKHAVKSIALILVLLTLLALLPVTVSADTPVNLYREDEAPVGSYYTGGVEKKGTKYRATNLCPVAGKEKVFAGPMDAGRNSAVPVFCFFREDGSFLCDVTADQTTVDAVSRYYAIFSAAIPADAAGVRVNFSRSDFIPAVSTDPFTSEEYIAMTGNEKPIVRKDSPLYRKKILFCGDSICEATVEKGNPSTAQIAGWAGRIGTYNDMEFVNKGLGGAAFSYFNPEKNPTYLILTQLQSLESEAESFDLVLLHGGVNDMWDKATIGEIAESRDPKDFDMQTFAGAMEATICYAKETYRNAAIGFLINFQTHSGFGYLGNSREMKKYWDLAKQICDKWEIPYLDMYNEAPFKRMKIPTDHGGDGIHPIYEGYEMLYPHIEKFVESLVPLIPEKDPVPGETSETSETSEVVTSETSGDAEKKPTEKTASPVIPLAIGGVAVAAAACAGAGVAVSKKKKKQ